MSNYVPEVRRRWPDADVRGQGRFAAVALCGPRTRVTLHASMADACAAMMSAACGLATCDEHEAHDLDGTSLRPGGAR